MDRRGGGQPCICRGGGLVIAYHSTGISLATRHCPAALDFAERGDQPLDRRGFEVGIACHAVLEAVGRETEERARELEIPEIEEVSRSVGIALVRDGREFDGRPEPPLNAESVFAGRELAEQWLSTYPILPSGARYEIGLAVDASWNPVPYDSPEAWLATIIDVTALEDYADEDGEGKVLRIRDYKTAWSAGPGELGTLQRKIQAVLARRCLPEAEEADVIRLEVAAVRRWTIYPEDVLLAHGGEQRLKRWRQEIADVVGVLGGLLLAGNGARPASPGAGCVGCPYLYLCPDAQLYFGATGLPEDPKERARAYMVASAVLTSLRPMLEADADGISISLPDGSRVGWQGTEGEELMPDAHRELARMWCEASGAPEALPIVSSALAALGGLSLTAARKMVRAIYPSREDADLRHASENSLVRPVRRRSWQIWKEEQAP